MNEIQSEFVKITLDDGTPMDAWFSRPSGQKAKRGLLVLQEAFGVNAHIREVTERFAKQGFAAIAPELFHRTAPARFEGSYTDFGAIMPHLQALTEAGMDNDIRATYKWITQHEGVGDAVASVGYCMGGRASFAANSAVPLKAAISYYGGNIPPLLHRASNLSGPMLLFWGELDTHIPADQRRQVTDAMRAAGKSYVEVAFSNAGHAFFCDARPSYDAEAAALSWDLTLAFLNRHCA